MDFFANARAGEKNKTLFKMKCICLHRWKINCAIGLEQVVPFLKCKCPAVCASGHEGAALHQPIDMREAHLSKVFNLSITASTTFTDELCVSEALVLCLYFFITLYINVVQWMHMILSVSIKHKQETGLSHYYKIAFIVGKICYCYYTYFVKGVDYLNMADVTDVSM